MASRENDLSPDGAGGILEENGAASPAGQGRFNPRLLPPLIGLGLLLAIAMVILLSRGGRPKQEEEEIDARVIRRVEQTPDFTYLELEDGEGTLWLATPRVDVQVDDRVHFKSAKEFRDFE